MNAHVGGTPYQMADELYRQGLAALVLQRPDEALWSFRSALKLYRSAGALPSWRCLSYFGLTLAMVSGGAVEAIRACESALKSDVTDAQLYLNLARVYLLAGRRPQDPTYFLTSDWIREAIASLSLGLRVMTSTVSSPAIVPITSPQPA